MALKPGRYKVDWHSVGHDTHRDHWQLQLRGRSLMLALARGLYFAASMLLFGASRLQLAAARPPAHDPAACAIRPCAGSCCCWRWSSGCAWLGLAAAAMADAMDQPSGGGSRHRHAVRPVLPGAHAGAVWPGAAAGAGTRPHSCSGVAGGAGAGAACRHQPCRRRQPGRLCRHRRHHRRCASPDRRLLDRRAGWCCCCSSAAASPTCCWLCRCSPTGRWWRCCCW